MGLVTWHVGLLREEGKGPEGARVTLVFGALGPVLRGGIRAQGPSAEGDRTTATLRPRQDPPTPALKSARFSLPVYFGGRKLLGAALAASRPRFGHEGAPVRRAGSAFVSAMPGKQACLQPSYLPLDCRPCPPAHTAPLFHCAGSDPEQPGSEQESTRAPG
jgi:hypothetical protein